jgi:hypothetical protein
LKLKGASAKPTGELATVEPAETQTPPLTPLPGETIIDEIIGNIAETEPVTAHTCHRWKFHVSSKSRNTFALNKNELLHFLRQPALHKIVPSSFVTPFFRLMTSFIFKNDWF